MKGSFKGFRDRETQPATTWHDPQLLLHCPKCGQMLRYGVSTSGDVGEYQPGEIFQAGADVHHYACTNGSCGTCWKFGPNTPLLEDPLRLADSPETAL